MAKKAKGNTVKGKKVKVSASRKKEIKKASRGSRKQLASLAGISDG